MWKQRNALGLLWKGLLDVRVSPFLKAVWKYLEKQCSPTKVKVPRHPPFHFLGPQSDKRLPFSRCCLAEKMVG